MLHVEELLCLCDICLQLGGEVSPRGFDRGLSSTSSAQLHFGGPTRFFGLDLVPDSAHGAELQEQLSEASQELLDFHTLLQSKLYFPSRSQQASPIIIPLIFTCILLFLGAAAHSGLLNIMEIIHQPLA